MQLNAVEEAVPMSVGICFVYVILVAVTTIRARFATNQQSNQQSNQRLHRIVSSTRIALQVFATNRATSRDAGTIKGQEGQTPVKGHFY